MNKPASKDQIVYKIGDLYSLDQQDVETKAQLSAHYEGKVVTKELEKLVINPREVYERILKKVTPEEKFILTSLDKLMHTNTRRR